MSLSRHETRPLFWSLLAVTGLMLQLLPALSGAALAQPAGEAVQAAAPEDEKKEDAATPQSDDKKTPLARYVVVESPVNDAIFRHVRNTALSLQDQASRENRAAFLFLEIRPGQSEFHQVSGLAQFLSSSKVNRLTTVAWVPETVTGNNVVVALGCNEIVMQPDASLGDIGRGRAVDVSEEQAVLSLVDKRHNLQVSHDLALGLMNPDVTLLQVSIERDGTTEKRIVTEQQAKVLRENQLAIVDAQVIKDKGKAGLFSGRQAREQGFLVTHTAAQQAELADLYRIDPQSLKVQASTPESKRVRLIEVTEIIDPVLESFIERQIQRALSEGAQTLIFQIKSPGGYLISGTNLAARIAELEEENIRTIAYIPEQALSSAAITALGCDEIYIGPSGQIGDAGVIQKRFDGAFERAPEKVVSPLVQTLKSLAEQKHRPAAVLEAMTLKDLQVYEVRHRDTGRIWYMSEEELAEKPEWIKGPLVAESREDLLLTLQGDRAVELKIAEAVVEDIDALKDRLNIPPDVELKPVGRTWVDTLVYILNDPFITGFLFFIAIVCIYIELHFMIGFFGICAALCFGVFFWSRYLGGTATGLEMVLFLIGIACILMEVLVVPGFGVFGVTGGLLMLASLVLASETFNNLEPSVNSQKLVQALSMIGLPLLAVIVSSMFIGKYLPQIPVLKHIVLMPPTNRHAGDTDSLQLRPDLVEQNPLGVGRQGVSLTILRPSGKARFEDQIVDVVTQGPYVQPNTPIEIVESRGNRIVVREQDPSASSTS
uniref:Uncharacterized protein n=2 Tax=Rubinisphaera brasiliensis TaxID=119 RepID=F0SKY1_RUBBR|nr:protein of unknown function DUF107 [Rubinisphaera brasiliensis DSM 5305]